MVFYKQQSVDLCVVHYSAMNSPLTDTSVSGQLCQCTLFQFWRVSAYRRVDCSRCLLLEDLELLANNREFKKPGLDADDNINKNTRLYFTYTVRILRYFDVIFLCFSVSKLLRNLTWDKAKDLK